MLFWCITKLGSQCIENSIQLVGDLSHHEGIPVICLGGSWGKVCDVSTPTATAAVVCRQLGFSADGEWESHVFYVEFHPMWQLAW